MDPNVYITKLTQPAGACSTYAYGLTEDDGYVKFKHKNGWFSIDYMRGDQLLPVGRERVYYDFRGDFSLFSATPTELSDATPGHIHVPDSYTDLSREVDRAMHAAWHGTRWERGTDNIVDTNYSRLFQDFPVVSDETWEQHCAWRALVESVAEGWETEANVRAVVGNEYYDALTNHGVRAAVGVLNDE